MMTVLFENMLREDILHKQCVEWFENIYNDRGAILHHSPNENPRGDKIQMIKYNNKMKSLGRKAGFPDLTIFYQSRVIFIELKTAQGKLSNNQENFKFIAHKNNFDYYIVRSLEEFMQYVSKFMNCVQ
jgi:hypothetical protein